MRKKYDIVVAGAGPAGIAAAVEAARSGARVALIERYGIVGGNLTAGYVGPIMGAVCCGTIADEIIDLLCPDESVCPDFEIVKYELTLLLQREKIETYLQTVVINAAAENGFIKEIEAFSRGKRITFEADIYIDATGDGELAVLAGCDYMMGRDTDSLVQPVSLMFVISGVDVKQTLTCCHEEHKTILDNGKEYLSLCREAHAAGELPETVNIVRLYKTQYSDERMVNATQANGINPLDTEDVFIAEIDLRSQIYQVLEFLKKRVPGFENIRIKGSASTLGIRESRRIIGDYIISADDVINSRKFSDAIVHLAGFPMDIHNPSGPGQSVNKTGRPLNSGRYDIPYSCLRPRGLENLLIAGRCISGTHEAASSYRVMKIALAIGQAAGAAAYLASKQHCTTRALDAEEIRKHLKRKGVKL